MTATVYETQTAAVVAGTATIDAGETTTEDIVIDSKQNLALVVPELTSAGSETSNQTMFTFLGQAFDGGEFEEITDEHGRPLTVQVVAGERAPVPEIAAYFYAIRIVATVAQAAERAIEFVASAPGYSASSSPSAATSGGASPGKLISAGASGGDPTLIKAAPGQIYTLWITNINAAVRYAKFYDRDSAPSSLDVPEWTLPIPGNTAGAGGVVQIPVGLEFLVGIGLRLTTGVADNDNNAVAAGEVVVNWAVK